MAGTAISADGRSSIEKQVAAPKNIFDLEKINDDNFDDVFEVKLCISWLNVNNYKKVCLQLPDEMLPFAPQIVDKLESSFDGRCYVLADSTYGSCCVDEKTALHVPEADCLIHFGSSCLSNTCDRFPVLYVLTKPPFCLLELKKGFLASYDAEDPIVILYDTVFHDLAERLYESVSHQFSRMTLSRLIIPSKSKISEESSETQDDAQFPDSSNTSDDIVKCNRRIMLPPGTSDLKSCKIFYIGDRTLPNLLLELPHNEFRVFDPCISSSHDKEPQVTSHISKINKLIRKRSYYIEKLKDASSVGILVGTLAVHRYLEVIDRLKRILKAVGKSYYVVAIGEIDPCKLANFMDIECFVFVGCPETMNYYISDESKGQFFQPIVTPFDVEIAFCNNPMYNQNNEPQYVMDWKNIVDKGPPQLLESKEDVSLITGGLRLPYLSNKDSNIIVWQGLDDSTTAPTSSDKVVQPGQSGIPSYYSSEPFAPDQLRKQT